MTDSSSPLTDVASCTAEFHAWIEQVPAPSTLPDGVRLSANWKPLYFVSVSARSGSDMLCSALRGIPELGNPDEYLNARGPLQNFQREFGGSNLAEYIRGIFSARAPANTLGIKAGYLDFRFLAESPLGPYLADFANFIYLTRRDIYAQAVSLWAARKTALWHSSDGSLSSVSADMYALEELMPEVQRLLRERVQWESFFSMAGVIPLRLVYEDFCGAKLAGAVAAVAQQAGFEVEVSLLSGLSASTTKTSSKEQEAIARRLRGDCASLDLWLQMFPRSAARTAPPRSPCSKRIRK